MSVAINIRKSLGSDSGPQEIIHQLAAAINEMEWSANEMGVTLDWTTLVLNVGNEYEEMTLFTGNIRHNFIVATVYGERTGQ